MYIINIIASICACVVPSILFTFFIISIVEKVEKDKPIKWLYLIIALALIASNTWGHKTGYEAAIKEAELVDVQGYTYTLNFDGEIHEYVRGYNFTK